IYTGAFGKADVAQNRPMAPDTIFRIASMTKPVTSLAAMMLVEHGQIGLDDPVAKYLPEFSNVRVLSGSQRADGTFETRPPRRAITIRDLLTHTSGIAYSFVDARLAKLDDGHKSTAELPLVCDPGERFVYGPNTAVLGDIIAKVSGMPLDAVFATRIFEPLGMHDTAFSVPRAKRDRVVTVHTRAVDGSLREMRNPVTLTAPPRGDGGLFSTAADYARFIQLFLNRGRLGTTRLISDRTFELMTSNEIGSLRVAEQPSSDASVARPFPLGAGKDTFGFGFQIEGRPAAAHMRSAGSLSWGGIFNTHFWIDPQRSLAAVVLMQVLPYYDPAALGVLRGFEREVYRMGRVKPPPPAVHRPAIFASLE
ncbi:MAG TPA: serine hydrolase domain-containing protein, partial [Vicinamibacterales bacterium]|nr:serine hydrolase domain-containing protein [Vicinamibacterales bacterium]